MFEEFHEAACAGPFTVGSGGTRILQEENFLRLAGVQRRRARWSFSVWDNEPTGTYTSLAGTTVE